MRKIWIVACGSNDQWKRMWPEWLKEGHITVGCNSPNDLDLSNPKLSLRELRDRVRDGANGTNQAAILEKFAYTIKDKDYVVVRKGLSQVLGIGEVKDNILSPIPQVSWAPGDHYQRRRVDWLYVNKNPVNLTEGRFTAQITIQDSGIFYSGSSSTFNCEDLTPDKNQNYTRDFFCKIVELLQSNNHGYTTINTIRSQQEHMATPTTTNTILFGPPGTGKTHALTSLALSVVAPKKSESNHFDYAQSISNGTVHPSINPEDYQSWHSELQNFIHSGRVEFTTFHQNYAYEDFVEGLKAELDEKTGTVHYKIEPGILKRIAYRALYSWLTGDETDFELDNDQIEMVKYYLSGEKAHGNKPDDSIPNYVLIIDEINRGNVARIFGELITLVEDSKRACRELTLGSQPVFATLPYTKERFILPPNLHIIGTMNTADRSLIGLDAALRRRFDFIELPPRPKLLSTVDGINLQNFLSTLNQRIEEKDTRDHCIGHAYFMAANSFDDIQAVMRRKVIPQLQEYFHDRPTELTKLLSVGDRSFVNDKGVLDSVALGAPVMYTGFAAQ